MNHSHSQLASYIAGIKSEDEMTEEREKQIYSALRLVLDPEVGINIVDLGLVYSVTERMERIFVDMSMTSAACPMHGQITQMAEEALRAQLKPANGAEINIVWEPEWTPDMMSDEARKILGY
jgi:metal-sulfur cluster biosynthetic enzyme